MKDSAILRSLLLLLVASMILVATPSSYNLPQAKAQTLPILEVWSPVHRSSNMTDFTLTPGSTFDVRVNVTGAGPIAGFDITLNYNITTGRGNNNEKIPNAIRRVVSAGFIPGLFDGSGLPEGCTVFEVRNIRDQPPGTIRLAAVLQGGCTVDGTGTLFNVSFEVATIGATSIDIVQTKNGKTASSLIGGPPVFTELSFDAMHAYFRNKPGGLSPVAKFSFDPIAPIVGDNVKFNGTESYDPDDLSLPEKGVRTLIWDFDDGTVTVRGNVNNASIVRHRFLAGTATVFAAGTYQVKVVVIDAEGLPMREIRLVPVVTPNVHDITVSMTSDKSKVNVGETVRLTVTVANKGNNNETAILKVSYDYQDTILANEAQFPLYRPGNVGNLPSSRIFNYTLNTSNLPQRIYTITANAQIVNATTGVVIPDSGCTQGNCLIDNTETVSLDVLAPVQSSLSVPLLAGTAVVALIAVSAAVYIIRRRKKDETGL